MRKSDTPLTGHTYGDLFSSSGWEAPAWPLLLMSILLIIQYFFGNMLGEQLARVCPSLKIGDVDLNEDIDTYWNSLDDHDRKWSDEEEKHFRLFNNFDFKEMGCPKGSV